MTDPRLDLIQQVLKDLPTPLVGSVAYDGNKTTKVCTDKAFAAFSECYSLVRPRRVLEIGTHAGGSALMALALTDAKVLSVDIGHTWIAAEHSFGDWGIPSSQGGLNEVKRVLQSYFPGRFDLIIGDSTAATTRREVFDYPATESFDLCFVDGDHSYPFVKADIEWALSLGIKDIICDDYNGDNPNSEVAQAARETGLTLVKEWKDIHSGGVSFALLRAS